MNSSKFLGGYILQAIGLETTTAAHGSFTGTIMVLIVPVLVGLSGRKISNTTWIASLIALFGNPPLPLVFRFSLLPHL